MCAHCTCMAGLGETCSHVAALLFFVEFSNRHNEKSVTEKKCYWSGPGAKPVPYSKIEDLSFSTSKKKCLHLDAQCSHETEDSDDYNNNNKKNSVPALMKEDIIEMLTAMESKGHNCAIMAISSHFCSQTADLPQCLTSELFNENLTGYPYEQLIEYCDINIAITKEQCEKIELLTRNQSKSNLWFKHRAGRITASVLRSACHTSVNKPSISLIKKICYPKEYKIETEATAWGNKNEKIALEVYIDQVSKQHEGFNVIRSGLVINPEFPHMGASPDGVVSCTCCGKGIVEIKCPWSLKDKAFKDLENTSKFSIKDGGLKKNHAYYIQVQAQLK